MSSKLAAAFLERDIFVDVIRSVITEMDTRFLATRWTTRVAHVLMDPDAHMYASESVDVEWDPHLYVNFVLCRTSDICLIDFVLADYRTFNGNLSVLDYIKSIAIVYATIGRI